MSLNSTGGRIIVLKICSKVVLIKYLRSLSIVPTPLRAILNLEFIWPVKDNCLSKTNLSCLCSSTRLTGTLLTIKGGGGGDGGLALVKN